LKILFNNRIFFDQKYGGISRYFNSIFEIFIKDKIDFKVIAPLYKNLYLKNLDNSFKKGLYIPRYPLNIFLKKFNNSISRTFINNCQHDVLHDTYYSEDTYKIKSKKKIITIHDLIHEKYPTYYDYKNLIKVRKKIFKYIDNFICVSESTKEDLLNIYDVPHEKIKVIYHGGDHLDKIKIDTNKQKFEFEKKITKPFIFYVGKRYRYKNFLLLINAFKNSSMLKKNFQIIFFGGEKMNKKEAQIYKNANISNQIIHLNGDDEILKYLYLNAKVMVSTSEYEGFGLNVLEALKHDCPVVAKDIKVFRELYQNNITYFDDEDSLQYSLEKILSFDNKFRIDQNNLNKKFNWKNASSEILKVYKIPKSY
jgi:glycosyltransferase involved in cell wall biosynthesis